MARGLLLQNVEGGNAVQESRYERLRTRQGRQVYIVMVCEDLGEAAEVGELLSKVNTGSLITYRRAEDVLLNYPSGRVALIVLADSQDPAKVGRTLKLMRHRWPNCPIVVVGDEGGGELEMAARIEGASYLVRPVSSQQWAGMVEHVLGSRSRIASEERLG